MFRNMPLQLLTNTLFCPKGGDVMKYYIVIEKRKKNLDKFFELFSKNPEVSISDIKKKVSKSSFYKLVLEKIYELNDLVNYFEPRATMFESSIYKDQSNKVYQSFKINPKVKIQDYKGFFILEIENGS